MQVTQSKTCLVCLVCARLCARLPCGARCNGFDAISGRIKPGDGNEGYRSDAADGTNGACMCGCGCVVSCSRLGGPCDGNDESGAGGRVCGTYRLPCRIFLSRPPRGEQVRIDHSSSSSTHDCSTISFTFLSYSRRFSWYRRAASEFAGELGFGSQSSDWMEVRIADMS